MTPAQTKMYWREWAKVTAFCRANDLPVPDRHEIHRRALGRDVSSKQLSNSDLDAVLAAFAAIYDPDNLAPQLRAARGQRARMTWVLARLTRELAQVLDPDAHLDPSTRHDRARRYIGAILTDKYHTTTPDDLTDAQLRLLLMDISRAISHHRQRLTLFADAPF